MGGICDFPFELLIEIMRELDRDSNNAARLTCRRWGEAGAHCASHRVYYAPRPDRIDIFKSIPENTTFAASFTELIYDARLCHRGVLEGDDRVYREERLQSREQYASCLRHQTSILETGQDLETLCMGMKRLPNLQQISILDYFPDVGDDLDLTQHKWYRSWTSTQSISIAKPSEIDDSLWDFRGIQNLFKAILLYAPKVKSLKIDWELGKMSTRSFSKPNMMQMVKNIIPRLRKLYVDCGEAYDDNIDKQWSKDIASLLNEGQQLNEMALCLDWSLTLTGKWPQLRVLEFQGGHLNFCTLKAFSQFHANVLRELTLGDVVLRGKHSWEEVAEELGQYWKLNRLSLLYLKNDPYYPGEIFVGLRQLKSIARSLMRRIPYDDLNMVNDKVTVIAWNKQNYVRDLDFRNCVSSFPE